MGMMATMGKILDTISRLSEDEVDLIARGKGVVHYSWKLVGCERLKNGV